MFIRNLIPNMSSIAPRTVSSLLMAKRQHHVAAAGALHAFNQANALHQLTEPTMVSTILSRQQALHANPQLEQAEQLLQSHGHHVAYEVDATQLHNPANPGVSAMNATAAKNKVNMSTMSVDFLRSQGDLVADQALFGNVAHAAAQSGVTTLTATHSQAQDGNSHPTQQQWIPAATGAGYQHVGTENEKRTRTVESVLQANNQVKTLEVHRAAVSKFKLPDITSY